MGSIPIVRMEIANMSADKFINKLGGLLLGDGGISKQNFYTQSSISIEWLEDISYWFRYNGFNSNIYPLRKFGFNMSQLYKLYTSVSPIFEEQRKRWYKHYYVIDGYPEKLWHEDEDGEYFIWHKIIPFDIFLTPECVANWYMGDGSIYKRKLQNSYVLSLATDSFTKKEVNFLVDLLNEQITDNFYLKKKRLRKSGEQSYIIQLTKRENISEFIEYIRPCVVSCFDYKIPDVF